MMKIIPAKSNFMSWQLHHWNGQLANYAIALYSAENSFSRSHYAMYAMASEVWRACNGIFDRIMNIIMLHLLCQHMQMSEKFPKNDKKKKMKTRFFRFFFILLHFQFCVIVHLRNLNFYITTHSSSGYLNITTTVYTVCIIK